METSRNLLSLDKLWTDFEVDINSEASLATW